MSKCYTILKRAIHINTRKDFASVQSCKILVRLSSLSSFLLFRGNNKVQSLQKRLMILMFNRFEQVRDTFKLQVVNECFRCLCLVCFLLVIIRLGFSTLKPLNVSYYSKFQLVTLSECFCRIIMFEGLKPNMRITLSSWGRARK